MKEFSELCSILERLMGPDGCPWDQRQTFQSLRESVLEEAHEVIEAINRQDDKNLCEELGDLAANLVFFCKLAEKEERFTTEEVLTGIVEKLVRRHPHVFGDVELSSPDELFAQWERIKTQERQREQGPHEGIPRTLPSLARAQKVLKRMRKRKLSVEVPQGSSDEDFIGQRLLRLVDEAEAKGVDAEQALLRTLAACAEGLS